MSSKSRAERKLRRHIKRVLKHALSPERIELQKEYNRAVTDFDALIRAEVKAGLEIW